MTRRRKVLWLIKGLGLGGAEKLLSLSLPYIDRDKYDYEVAYLLPWKNALVDDFRREDIPVHCLNQSRPYDIRTLWRLNRLLRNENVDVLHVHLPYSGIMGRIASRMSPVKAVVYTEHNLWQRYHKITSLFNKITYRWNDAVIAVSNEVEHSIRDNYSVNGKPKLDVIPNGVDIALLQNVMARKRDIRPEFGIPADHAIVVHVANFTPKKRHCDLLEAVKLVINKNCKVTFILVGQGPLQEKTEADARRLGIEDNVVFAGFRADATDIMAAADMFVLPSQFEGMPVSMLEAMALGTPVIASRVGGIPEVLEDRLDGILIDAMEPGQLADSVLRLLADQDLRATLSNKALIKVRQKFSIEDMVRSTESVYDEMLKKATR